MAPITAARFKGTLNTLPRCNRLHAAVALLLVATARPLSVKAFQSVPQARTCVSVVDDPDRQPETVVPQPAQPSDRLGSAVGAVEAERWQEDLRYLAYEMPKRHKNLYHLMTCAQFEIAIRRLHERIPSLARHEIIVELARIVAMVGDGHTNIAPTRDPKIGFRTLPLTLHLFRDGLFVRAARREHAEIVGARRIRKGKLPADRAISRVSEIVGRDNEMDIKELNTEANPWSPWAHAALGEAYQKNGNRESAIQSFEKSLKLYPQNPDLIESLKQLRQQ
jgi:tetratricopeptide (TPR) repeat protein